MILKKVGFSPMIVQALGIEDFKLWTCPEQYRHLLHDERRQELNKRVKKRYIKMWKKSLLYTNVLKKKFTI